MEHNTRKQEIIAQVDDGKSRPDLLLDIFPPFEPSVEAQGPSAAEPQENRLKKPAVIRSLLLAGGIGGIAAAVLSAALLFLLTGKFNGSTPVPLEGTASPARLGSLRSESAPTGTESKATGRLFIEPIPGDAKVSIRGVNYTPGIELDQAKQYVATISREGFQAIEHKVTLAAGEDTRLYVRLSPAGDSGTQTGGSGRLFVEVQPADALVRVDDHDFQQGMELPPGEYDLQVSKTGFEPMRAKVVVRPQQDIIFRTVLTVSRAEEVADPASKLPTMAANKESAITSDTKEWTEPVTGMEFVWIPSGCYLMGSPRDEEGWYANEGPQHEVCVEGFWLGKYEVTQGEWRKVMGSNPAYFRNGDRYPVEEVSWYDAQEFVKKLVTMSVGSYAIRLPREAEWEYACRAGTTTPFYFGGTINTGLANYDGGYTYGIGTKGVSRKQTTMVGSFPANAFGLHDMHGNVWEWCDDIYSDKAYDTHKRKNPIGMEYDHLGRSYRVLRGGSLSNGPRSLRSANRERNDATDRSNDVGFRLVRTR